MEREIRIAQAANWEAIRAIYLDGIATGQATFETAAPDWQRWDSSHLPFARLLACSGNNVEGWAALSPVSARPVYSGVAEVSVYVAEHSRGKRVGKLLLEHLITAAEQNGIWTLQASIFPENEASVGLHKHCGFREVGVRERIGRLQGVWRNTVLFERRSKQTGNN